MNSEKLMWPSRFLSYMLKMRFSSVSRFLSFVDIIQIRGSPSDYCGIAKVCVCVSPAGITRPHHRSEVFLRDVALRVLLTEVVELHSEQLPVFVGRVGYDEVEVSVGEA